MTRSRFLVWSFNDQENVIGSDQNFKRYVAENIDEIESEAEGRFAVLGILALVQIILLALILWRVW